MVRVGSQVKVHLAILILCLPYRVLEGTLALADIVQSYTLKFLLVIHLSFSASHASHAITALTCSQACFMTCLTRVWTDRGRMGITSSSKSGSSTSGERPEMDLLL